MELERTDGKTTNETVPLHDDEQALLATMHVLIQAEDSDDMRPARHPPMKLHLPSRFGVVVEDLEGHARETTTQNARRLPL